ncbi:MAG: helix-turn-helix domain-containing protein [Lachnospiraceae bacterium]|nr:helix-turn-helix domain-containing protein [Lachnospiraceae bacterium]
MNLELGNIIKRLRTEKSVTQDELAEYLGISYQAVSKWENGNTLPDITLLPKLASFFGIKIDELFSIDHEDELERVDNILKRETMTDRNYSYAKHILDGILQNDPKNVEAVKRYAKVYLSKSNDDLLEAGRMLEKAMTASPLDEELYSLYRSVRGGSEYTQHSSNDWFIRVCEPYAKKYTQNCELYQMLIEAMISMKYFDRAEDLLGKAQFEGENVYIREVLLGDLALAKGKELDAKDIWNSIPKDNWIGQYEAGERFNRLNDYEKAIECFTNAYEAQKAPHRMDMMYSLAFLYKKLGRHAKAKNEWEKIVETLIKEHNMSEDDNDVLWAKREISQLKSICED